MSNIHVEATVYPVRNSESKIRAMASVSIAGCVRINGVKVVSGGKEGIFVAMPSEKKRNGEGYQDIAHATTRELSEAISSAVLEKFNAL
jgi:stage V sporulation protein G